MARHPFYQNLLAGCILSSMTLTLAGCGMGASEAPSVYNAALEKAATEKAGPPPPPAAAEVAVKTADRLPADGLPADASWAEHQDKMAAIAPVSTPVSSPVPAPAGDMDARLAKLEKEVADMHSDMNMMLPALTKLVAAQQDLQQILARMDTASGTPNAKIADTKADDAAVPGNPKTIEAAPDAPTITMGPPPAAAEPDAQPAALTPAADGTGPQTSAEPAPAPVPDGPVPPAPAKAAPYAVSGIRFGEHGNMTRLVLDASGKMPYTYALDGSGTLMTLHLPGTDWRTASSSMPASSKLVESYTATPDGQGGYMVAVKLKRSASVSWADVMPPSAEGGTRVVFDLTPKS